MKKLLVLLSALSVTALTASATLIWSDTFTQADTSSFVNRAPEVGSGNIDGIGNIGILNNAITITPDGGSDRVEFESTAAGLAGVFQWDMSANSVVTAGNNLYFQMADGDSRSTGGTPLPNFSQTVNINGFTNGTSTLSLYFNISGADLNYTGPDASGQVLPSGGFDYWVDSTLVEEDDAGTSHTAGFPTAGVDTLVVQMFADQTGRVLTIDNASYNTFAVVPEPSSLALLILGLGCLIARRR